MTAVEVGAAMARRTARLTAANEPSAEKYQAMSRIFASEVSALTLQNVLKIMCGTGTFGPDALDGFMNATGCDQLNLSCQGIVRDMDRVADLVFER